MTSARLLVGPHTSPALSGLFVRSAQKGRCIVESTKTKNKLEETRELIQGLVLASKETTMGLVVFKGLSLAAIQMMLAGEELFDEDFVDHLKEKAGMLQKAIAEMDSVSKEPESEADAVIEEATESEPESEADAVIEEAIAAPKGLGRAIIASLVEDIEELLDHTTAEGQKEVLVILQASQPQRTAEYEAEVARDDARDNLINLVGESSYPAQTELYSMLTDFVKKSRGELTEAA